MKTKRIIVTMQRLGQSPKEVKCKTVGSGNWASCVFDKHRSMWQVLHVPSGLMVDNRFSSEEKALSVVEQLDNKPHLLPKYDEKYNKWIVTPEQYKEHITIIKSAKE